MTKLQHIWLLLMVMSPSFALPDARLEVKKDASILGKDATVYQVNVTVHHNPTSGGDAYNIKITDWIDNNVHLYGVRFYPKTVNQSAIIVSLESIVGQVALLRRYESISMSYTAAFFQNETPVTSASKAKVSWTSGRESNRSLGPAFSQKRCVVKNIVKQTSSTWSWRGIAGAIACGVACGCVIATLVLVLESRYSSSGRTFFSNSRDVVVDTNSSMMNVNDGFRGLPSYQQQKNKISHENNQHNAIKSLASRLLKKCFCYEAQKNSDWQPLTWQASLFSGIEKNKMDMFHATQSIPLLQFTLRMFTSVWKVALTSHIDQLLEDEQINSQTKAKFCDRLTEFYREKVKFDQVNESIDDFHRTNSSVLFTCVYQGILFHEELLNDTRNHERRSLLSKSKDPTLLKKSAEDWEIIKLMYSENLQKDMAIMFQKYLETLNNVSTICLSMRLKMISNGWLLVTTRKFIDDIHVWIKSKLMHRLDTLKKDRLLPDNLDASFREIFEQELLEVIASIRNRVYEVIEDSEKESLRSCEQHMQALKEDNEKTLRLLLCVCNFSSEYLASISSAESIIQNFSACISYAEVCSTLVEDSNVVFSKYFQSKFVECFREQLTVFTSRLKFYVSRIFREESSNTTSGYDANLSTAFSLLSAAISNLDKRYEKIVTRFSGTVTDDVAQFKAKESHIFQQSSHLGNINSRQEIRRHHVLFKSLLQCTPPLSSSKCSMQIEQGVHLAFASLTRQALQKLYYLQNYGFHTRLNKSPKNVISSRSSLLKRLVNTNEMMVEEVISIYNSVSCDDETPVAQDEALVKNFQQGTFSEVFRTLWRLKESSLVLQEMCTFLIRILSTNESASRDEGIIRTCNIIDVSTFVTKLQNETSMMRQAGTQHVLLPAIIKTYSKYQSTCETLAQKYDYAYTSIMDAHERMRVDLGVILNLRQQHRRMEQQCLMNSVLLKASWDLLRLLLEKGSIDMNDVNFYCTNIFSCRDWNLWQAREVIFGGSKEIKLDEMLSFRMQMIRNPTITVS